MKYEFSKIEKKWQERWEKEKVFAAVNGSEKNKVLRPYRVPIPIRTRPARGPSASVHGNGYHMP